LRCCIFLWVQQCKLHLAAYTAGDTPLHAAAEAGFVRVVQDLLAAGASVQAANSGGITPLLAAAAEGWHEVAQLLLDEGADVDAADDTDRTPLHAAAEGWHTDVVQLLLQRGADQHLEDEFGQTALSCAAAGGHADSVKALLEAVGQQRPFTSAQLVEAAKLAAWHKATAAFVVLAGELPRRYPQDLPQLFEESPEERAHATGRNRSRSRSRANSRANSRARTLPGRLDESSNVSCQDEPWSEPASIRDAMTAVLNEWSSYDSSITTQQGRLRRREEAVAVQRTDLREMHMRLSYIAKNSHQDPAATALNETGLNPVSRRSRKRQRE
jgi:hypothetical protein